MAVLAAYSKSVAAVLSALIAGLVLGLDDGELKPVEWLQAIGQAVAVGGVVFSSPRNKVTRTLGD